MTSDGGWLLLRETNRRLKLIRRLAECFVDRRCPWLIEHTVEEMLGQRIYALAHGYEDLNDHDQLRHDPLLAVLSGKRKPEETVLASKSTLNRIELSTEQADSYKKVSYQQERIDQLLVQVFVESQASAPEEIVLDLDVTDLALHGHQEGRFFHGYYDSYCYLPLYVFCGEHLLCSRLRTADQDAAAGAREEIERMVGQLRQAWPQVRIILRADSGFCREELMSWCEAHGVEYVFGLARNPRLRGLIDSHMAEAQRLHQERQEAVRVFSEFRYQTRESWSRPRRVIAKAEYLEQGENPRFVVTSLEEKDWAAQALYEELYCQREEMENRIKEQLTLFAGRVSAETMRANQLRVYLAAMAYVLLHGLRRLGLQGTELARAQAVTIRLRLLKIGAQIRITTRKIWVSMASSFPLQPVFAQAWQQLRC